MTTTFETYIAKVEADYRGSKATEHTYWGTLEIFMESLERGIEASNDPKHIECGAPDFIIEKAILDASHNAKSDHSASWAN